MIWCSPPVFSFLPKSLFLTLYIFLTWKYLGLFSILFLILNLGSNTVWYALTPWDPRPPWALTKGQTIQGPLYQLASSSLYHLTSHSAVVWNKTITRIIPPFNLLMISNKHKLFRLALHFTFSLLGSLIYSLAFAWQWPKQFSPLLIFTQ